MAELKNLDALADQLYQDGMERAKNESERLLSQTGKRVEEMLANARKEAHEIISESKREAEKHRSAVESEIHQKSKQLKQDIKSQIENLITTGILSDSTKVLLSDKEFVGQLILSAMETWNDGDDVDLNIAEKLGGLKKDVEKKVHSALPDIRIKTDNDLDSGFKIENNSKGYILSFTDQDFRELFKPYLSDAVSNILFESGR